MVGRVMLSTGTLKVSKPGYEVTTEGNPNNLAFDSSKGVMIWYSALYARPATIAINTAGSEGKSYPSLPYVPCFVFQHYNGTVWQQGTGGFIDYVNTMTTNTFSIWWNQTVTHIRVNIYTIAGQQ